MTTSATVRRVGRPDSPVNTASWTARTENTLATRHALEVKWLAVRKLLRLWKGVDAPVAELTATWPSIIAEYMRDVHPTEVGWIGMGDMAVSQVNGTPPSWARPLIRPLLDSARIVVARAAEPVERYLLAPDAPRKPKRATSTAEARAIYNTERTKHVELKTQILRGGYVRREIAKAACFEAMNNWRVRWWSIRGRLVPYAGNYNAALAFAEQARIEALEALRRLDLED